MDIKLNPGEAKIDAWALLYLPPDGGRYNGTLLVTNQRLVYGAKFDLSFKGMAERAAPVKWSGESIFEIAKKDIAKVAVENEFLNKKCIVTLSNGSKHTFDYGSMNIDKVVASVEAR